MAHGDGRIFPRRAWFWIAYCVNGDEQREAAKGKDGQNTADRETAEKFLRARIKQLHASQVTGQTFETAAMRKLTVSDLLASLKTKYETNGQASAQNLSHLKRADTAALLLSAQK